MLRRLGLTAAALGMLLAALPARAQEIVIATQNLTGDTFQLATAWSNILAREKPAMKLTPIEGGGTSKLLRTVATKKADIGYIGSPHYRDAVDRVGSFAQEPAEIVERYKNMRALFAIPTGMGQMVVRADSGIKTLGDLKGKSVAIGLPGGSAGHMWEVLFRLHGVDPAKSEVKTHYLEYNRALDQIGNGQLDGTHVYGGVPQAGLYNASRSNRLRYLSLDPKSRDAFAKAMPNGEWYVYRELSADAIRAAYGDGFDVSGPVYNWAFPMMLIVRADMPDDTAYAIVKALWENIDEVRSNNTQLRDLSLDKALEKVSAEIHPGAARYFREKGLSVPKS